MAQILRGDIYWADLDPTKGHEQSGQRPVLILSNDIFNQRSGMVIAMALTSQPQRAGFPPHAGTGRREPAEKILGENQPDSHPVSRAIEPENRTGQTGRSGTGHHGTEPNRRSIARIGKGSAVCLASRVRRLAENISDRLSFAAKERKVLKECEPLIQKG